MNLQPGFDDLFRALTGLPSGETPFPWQQALFEEFLGKSFRTSCDVPTGLGKTSVIAVWLLALAQHARNDTAAGFPRRLVYVVNRRTVVDQATQEAEHMRGSLETKPELQPVVDALRKLATQAGGGPLAISTLRGQFADNAEWRDDPTRPAVIVGTVDMIGSRLLFAGYGRGFKSRPLHAGFLGQDALLVHDEAHLEPAFQTLIKAIETEQQRCHEFRRLRVMALTATSRSDESCEVPLYDHGKHLDHPVAEKRITAKKGMFFRPVAAERQTAEEVARWALKHKDKAILVFLRRLEDVTMVANQLVKAKQAVQKLTGTMRGLERDALAKQDPIFARFMPRPGVAPRSGPVYLVCTSAGEVGVNISADHLICDLAPFDSMAQRLGRVNRFGDGNAQVDVVYETEPDVKKKDDPYEQARWRTLELLRTLPVNDEGRHEAGPAALQNLPAAARHAAFTPAPVILPATDILLDAWALTSVRERLPGRPLVADWLHGVSDWEPPETHVTWREEVGIITRNLLQENRPEDLLDDYPLKPHELLRDRMERTFRHMEVIAARSPAGPVWLVLPDGSVRVLNLAELVAKDRQKKPLVNLTDCTVVLPPDAGGLGFGPGGVSTGMLDGDTAYQETHRALYDVADGWTNEKGDARRRRVWDDQARPPGSPGMRLVRTVDTDPEAEDDKEDSEESARRRYWHWYVRPRSADDDGSRTAIQRQELDAHLKSVECVGNELAAKLGLSDPEVSAVRFAAKWHDCGKRRAVWQRSVGNPDYPRLVLAKSARMATRDLGDYRHEFGSLLDVLEEPEFKRLPGDVQDLALHLIAAHHGRARPHFPAPETFDPERSEREAADLAREVPRRFARLQRRYGRWGLAYLESLVRAADAMGSQADAAPASSPGASEATAAGEVTR